VQNSVQRNMYIVFSLFAFRMPIFFHPSSHVDTVSFKAAAAEEEEEVAAGEVGVDADDGVRADFVAAIVESLGVSLVAGGLELANTRWSSFIRSVTSGSEDFVSSSRALHKVAKSFQCF